MLSSTCSRPRLYPTWPPWSCREHYPRVTHQPRCHPSNLHPRNKTRTTVYTTACVTVLNRSRHSPPSRIYTWLPRGSSGTKQSPKPPKPPDLRPGHYVSRTSLVSGILPHTMAYFPFRLTAAVAPMRLAPPHAHTLDSPTQSLPLHFLSCTFGIHQLRRDCESARAVTPAGRTEHRCRHRIVVGTRGCAGENYPR